MNIRTASVLLAILTGCSDARDFSFHYRDRIPWELVPLTDPTVSFGYNLLETVNLPPNTARVVRTLYLNNNLLTAFPDLWSISTTLDYLKLSDNPIAYVDGDLLFQLSVLRVLEMSNCPLSRLPDVSYFPPSLESLFMYSGQLEVLPDVCFFMTSHVFQFEYMEALPCGGQTTLWSRIALAAGTMETNTLVCGTPDQSTLLKDIPVEDFIQTVHDADLAGVRFAKMSTDELARFACRPVLAAEIPGTSRPRCASSCRQLVGCVVFAVDAGTCVLTQYSDGAVGELADFADNRTWYRMR